MKHHFKPEKSSSIDHCSHDDEKNILTIKFTSGAIYHYSDCPHSVYVGLTNTKSAGKYFHAIINGKYKEFVS